MPLQRFRDSITLTFSFVIIIIIVFTWITDAKIIKTAHYGYVRLYGCRPKSATVGLGVQPRLYTGSVMTTPLRRHIRHILWHCINEPYLFALLIIFLRQGAAGGKAVLASGASSHGRRKPRRRLQTSRSGPTSGQQSRHHPTGRRPPAKLCHSVTSAAHRRCHHNVARIPR